MLDPRQFAELIKRIAFLQDLIPDPNEKIVIRTPEEELAEEILRARGEASLAEELKGTAPGAHK